MRKINLYFKIFTALILIFTLTSCVNESSMTVVDFDLSTQESTSPLVKIKAIEFADKNNKEDLYLTFQLDNTNRESQELRLKSIIINGYTIPTSFYAYLDTNTIEIINVIVDLSDFMVINEKAINEIETRFSLNNEPITLKVKNNLVSKSNLVELNSDLSYFYQNNKLFLLVNNDSDLAKDLTINSLSINKMMFNNEVDINLPAKEKTLLSLDIDKIQLDFNEIKSVDLISFYYTIDSKKEAIIDLS